MFNVSTKQGVTCVKMGRTFFGRPLRVTHAFLLDGLVVEGGCPCFKKQLGNLFAEKQPEQAVFTHGHEDHAGNIDLFNSMGIKPYVHREAVNYLSSAPVIPHYRRFVWGNPAAGESQSAGAFLETDHFSFQVIASPGHSEDHICLYEERQGWLFTGDLYVGEKIIYLYENENLNAMKETLKELSKLAFSTMFCTHRGLLQKGPEALSRKLKYLELLEDQAKELKAKGFSVGEITKALLGREDFMHMFSGGEFSKTTLVKALLETEA